MSEVAICIITFRRVDQLHRLLKALSEQHTQGFSLSIIVVDNDPEMSAEQLCAESSSWMNINVRYFSEPVPGIVAARNRCVTEFLASTAGYLAFIDDDEWPMGSDWVASMLECLHNFKADIVAGDVLSVQGEGTPAWATQILYEKSERAEGEAMPVFYTGNVLISRAVLEQLNPAFDTRFAMTGASDYHFALRCAQAGFAAVFAQACVIEEFPAERATTTWFIKRGFRSGSGYTRSHLLEDSRVSASLRCIGLSGLRCIRGTLLLLRGAISFDKAMIVKGLFRISAAAGTLAGLTGLTYSEYQKLHS